MDEFTLIQYIQDKQKLHQINLNNKNIPITIGDDAAAVMPPDNHEIIITSDTLISGVHFFKDSNPKDIGHKVLAVNLSDLAAMGATPAWFTLNLTLPEINKAWVTKFCDGLFSLAKKNNITLVGGDTTKSLENSISITITAIGYAPKNKAITRSKANPGDGIYLSGEVGLAGYLIEQIYNNKNLDNKLKQEYIKLINNPMPQNQLGINLRDIASSCIDISDGLCADLYHILNLSNVSANLYMDKFKIPKMLNKLTQDQALEHILYGGDDYQLCFTAPKNVSQKLVNNKTINNQIFKIGEVIASKSEKNSELFLIKNKNKIKLKNIGYQHFSNN